MMLVRSKIEAIYLQAVDVFLCHIVPVLLFVAQIICSNGWLVPLETGGSLTSRRLSMV
jgi:hypothetical protein